MQDLFRLLMATSFLELSVGCLLYFMGSDFLDGGFVACFFSIY